MDLFYTLRALSNLVYDARSVIYTTAVNISGIYLLGQYLYPPLARLAAGVGVIAAYISSAADDWIRFRGEILSKIGSNADLLRLVNYIDDIISIVRDPEYFIKTGIKAHFPTLYSINNNLARALIDALIQSTGLTYSFLSNPIGFISGVVMDALGDLIKLRNNPRDYIIDKLTQFVPELKSFLLNPRGWIKSEIGQILPGLDQFIKDPESYIIEKMLTGFERLLSSYVSRLTKIAENIINRIF